MKPKVAAWLILLAVGISGCRVVTGSGDIVTVDVPIEDVARVVVSHSFELNVTVGDLPSLTLRVDDNLEESLDVGMDGTTLVIGLDDPTTVSNATLEADLTVPSLEAIEGSGSVDINLAALTGPTFDLRLSGASAIEGPVDFGSMTGEISGASNLSLSGRVGTLDIAASGASDLSLLELEVDDLRITLSGASNADVTVNVSIEASLSGASELRYRGEPDVNTLDVSGASTIGRITEPG